MTDAAIMAAIWALRVVLALSVGVVLGATVRAAL